MDGNESGALQLARKVIADAVSDGITFQWNGNELDACGSPDNLAKHKPALLKNSDAILAAFKEPPRRREGAKPGPSLHDPARGEDGVPKPLPEPETEPGLNCEAKPPDGGERHAKPRQPEPSRLNESDYERARSALAFIPPDDRDMWVSMGMALKDGFGDEGFGLWDPWSRKSDRYDERDARDVWRSVEAGGGITLGTLFHEAKARDWRDEGTYQKPTPEEIEARRRLAEERAAKEKARSDREHAKTASKARAVWKASSPATPDHPYLLNKGVSPVPSLREIDAAEAADLVGYAPKYQDKLDKLDKPLAGRLLVVPIKIAGKLSTLELIDEDGHKSALYGGAKAGGHWAAQPLPAEGGTEIGPSLTLLIGEGVATVLSTREATGYYAVAALSSGNLLAVAKAMRKCYPTAALVVLADLVRDTGLPHPHAGEAARAVGGRVAVPDFGPNPPVWAKDFNDMHQHRGLEAVADCIRRQVAAQAKDGAPPGSEGAPGSDSQGKDGPREARHQSGARASPGRQTSSDNGTVTARDSENLPTPMDSCAYYGLAGEMVKAIEPHTEADPAALLAQTLIAFGVLVGRSPYVQVEGDRHYLNLFGLLTGGTSKGRKGTSWGRVRSIFERIREWARVVSGLSSGEGLKYQVRDARPRPKRKRGKKMRHWQDPDYQDDDEDDDEQYEGVTDKRLLVIEPEFAQVLRAVARHGNTLSATTRTAWDTGNLATLTKKDPIKATGAHISIIGHVTVDELRAELTQTDTANGFANRFLFVYVKRSKCLPFGGEDLPESVVADFARRLGRAASSARRVGRVIMTQPAREIWERVYPDLSEGAPGLFGAATARAEAQAIRLALHYALLDEKAQIDAPHLLAALAVWEYAEASARYVFGASLGNPVADEILRAVRSAGQDGMTRTQIRDLFGRHRSAERIGAALVLLERRRLIRRRSQETGGRPTEIWERV